MSSNHQFDPQSHTVQPQRYSICFCQGFHRLRARIRKKSPLKSLASWVPCINLSCLKKLFLEWLGIKRPCEDNRQQKQQSLSLATSPIRQQAWRPWVTTGLVRGKMLLLTAINILVNDAFMGPSRVGNFRILRVLCDGVQILDGLYTNNIFFF